MKTAPSGRPLVLDGGLSNVLEAGGCDLHPTLWTAGLLRSDPGAILAAHLDYLRAGADIITTASYQASLPGYAAAGIPGDEAEALLRRSVELARRARAIFRSENGERADRVLIAASVGPYGAYLADGSEYTGSYAASDDELREFHESRLRCLVQSAPDLLAVETQPSLREVRVLAGLLGDVDIPAWVSFCCRDGARLHDGTPLSEAVAAVRDTPAVFAVGANCTAPSHMTAIIRLVRREAPAHRVVVYPNSGEVYDARTGDWRGTSDPSAFRELVAEWLAEGADIVGGCCRIGPSHIHGIRRALDERATRA